MINARLFWLILCYYISCPYDYALVPDTSARAKMDLLFTLPEEIHESSGLIYFQSMFWTFNDGGGGPFLFAIDPLNGKVTRKISIRSATNVDWEEITQDQGFLYVGDFGNNFGNRRDLKIYKINKQQLSVENRDSSVGAEVISFSYADQHDFSSKLFSTEYDCEAMISWGDSIVLFTKNWLKETTSVYCLPKLPGNYTLLPSFVFPSRGLVTGAAISEDRKELLLVGYEEFIPFVWLIEMNNSLDFRKNPKKRKSFLLMSGVQTEGICFGPDGYLYISCEHSLMPQSLFRLNPEHLRKSH